MPNPAPQPERCMLAHDLNNCLSMIIGECELLAELISNNPEAMERVRIILQTARRMANDISTRQCPIKL
jgi:nitrogen-specific signal transduction histidine kinase